MPSMPEKITKSPSRKECLLVSPLRVTMPGNPWVRGGLTSEYPHLLSTDLPPFLDISTHLGDVLDGSCHGFYLCRVRNSEVLTKVTEHPPSMVGKSYWEGSPVVSNGRGH